MGSPFAGPVWAPAGTMAARRKAAAAPILKRRVAADMETSRDVIPTNGRRALQRRHGGKRECIVAAWRVEITFFFRAMISGKVMHGPYQPGIFQELARGRFSPAAGAGRRRWRPA